MDRFLMYKIRHSSCHDNKETRKHIRGMSLATCLTCRRMKMNVMSPPCSHKEELIISVALSTFFAYFRLTGSPRHADIT